MQQTNFIFNVLDQEAHLRIDAFLSEKIEGKTRSAIQKLIQDGNVWVNEKVVAKNYKVRINDQISVVVPQAVEVDIKPQDIPLEIIYEDNDLLVVNKPKGMVVHPAPGNYEGTMVNALMHHCKDSLSGINGEIRPGIVHRIDKDTSGLLIVAKNDFAHIGLAQQIKQHSFLREYEAIVYGRIKQETLTIDEPIGRHKVDRKKMCVTDENSRHAITHIEVINQYEKFTHIRCRLETGRTHQIRVHLAYIGHPVAGDGVYGAKSVIKKLGGQCLHAKTIGFIHPVTNQEMCFTSELPNYFENFLNSLK